MAINAACHTMVYLAAHHCWIGVRTNLKTSNAIIVHVISFIITLQECKQTINTLWLRICRIDCLGHLIFYGME